MPLDYNLFTNGSILPSTLALALMQSYPRFALNLTSLWLDDVMFNPALPFPRRAKKYSVHVQ